MYFVSDDVEDLKMKFVIVGTDGSKFVPKSDASDFNLKDCITKEK